MGTPARLTSRDKIHVTLAAEVKILALVVTTICQSASLKLVGAVNYCSVDHK